MIEISFTPEFDAKIKKAIEQAARATLAEVKKKAGGGEVAETYHYRVHSNGFEIYSDDPRALYIEYGTGIRGDAGFKSYDGEKKPEFTKPIKAVEKKVLHWTKNGKEVFARSTKGMAPKAPLRETIHGNQEVIKKAFSDAFR